MNILTIGDIVGLAGCQFLRSRLPKIKKMYDIDLVIANGENSAHGNGITPDSAKFIFDCGVNVITNGNHTFRRKEIYDYLDETANIIRPANFPGNKAPGRGVCVVDMLKTRVVVVNLMGTVYMDSLDCPFQIADKIIKDFEKNSIIMVDFHAEATSEKRALGFYLDGRISGIFGTHTHVPTADNCLLPNGTGYITDLGMTGVIHSALGVKPEIIIEKLTTKLPIKFENANGPCKLDCAIFKINEQNFKAVDVKRLTIE